MKRTVLSGLLWGYVVCVWFPRSALSISVISIGFPFDYYYFLLENGLLGPRSCVLNMTQQLLEGIEGAKPCWQKDSYLKSDSGQLIVTKSISYKQQELDLRELKKKIASCLFSVGT